MRYEFKLMDENCAAQIANWHYEGMYAFYDMDQDLEDMQELLDPRSWVDQYYAVVNESDELEGYFSFFSSEPGEVTIGLGLRPDLTGKGLGQAFIEAGLDFAKAKFNPAIFRLSVAAFNKRAIRLYRKMGFQPDGVFMNKTNGGLYEFLRMVKRV